MILSGLPDKFKHPNIVEINHGIDTMKEKTEDIFSAKKNQGEGKD